MAPLQSARELVAESLARHLSPPPDVTVDAWAQRHRWLEKRTTAAAGPWRNARTPYLIEPQRAMTDPAVRQVVLMKSAQCGGSEVALNWFGRQIECDPGPLLWITSTLAQVQKLSRRRFDPMLDRAPLRERVARRKGRDSDRTTEATTFEAGSLTIATSGSPSALSSDPARDVVLDEVDRYAPSAGSEGDQLELARARQKTFEQYGARTVLVSTPSIDGASRIQTEYEDSDQRRYQVPCPECGGLQELVWYGKREDGHEFGVRWDRDVPKEAAPGTAYYGCEHCPARWSDAQRWAATAPEAGARWVARKPFRGVAGFYIPGLISSFVRLSDCVEQWIKSLGKPEKQQTFWNLTMGLPFSVVAEQAPEAMPLEAWDGFELPSPACCLLAFADVQADRLEVTVAGVGPDETVYVAEHRILHGVTKSPEVWADLESLLSRTWTRSDGKRIGLSALGIDCGYSFERVCDWADQMREKLPLRVFPIKGVGRGIAEPIVRERLPGKANSGRLFYVANSDAAKLNLIQRLQLRGGPGRVRFPARECFDAPYFEQLRSEKLKRRYVRGYPVVEWHLQAGARNEALDCLAGILAVLQWLNPALDVMESTNAKITAAPPPEQPRQHQPAERADPRADQLERALAELERRRAQDAPPPQPQVQVVRRAGGGAWFDGGGRGRRF